ncbi:MAG TPA: tetratricopeptide repeat protein [Ignavibacteria bacterium]|jgi:tetratricopeptide (TPR) repeat protein
MIKKVLIYTIAFFLLAPYLFSQSRDELIIKGIDYVYQLKFDSATAIFQPMADREPKDPTGPFFLAMTEWWRVYVNKEDHSNDDNYLSKVDWCIRVCDERIDANENDDWATFLKGGVIGYRGFINSIRENWLKAIDDGREGLNLIQRAYELNPGNKDAIFGIGLYNYAADYVVQRYPFLKAVLFFFPKGNKELGLQQLRDCAENGKFSKTEASVVLCFVHLKYEKNYPEAVKYAVKLTQMYPQNPMFQRFLGICYIGLFKWMEADTLYMNILANNDSAKTGYTGPYVKREASYYYAVAISKMNRLDEALKYYEQAYNLSKELDKDDQSPFQVFSVLGMGIIYDQKQNHSEAVKYYDRVIEMKDIDNSRETAQKFKQSGMK